MTDHAPRVGTRAKNGASLLRKIIGGRLSFRECETRLPRSHFFFTRPKIQRLVRNDNANTNRIEVLPLVVREIFDGEKRVLL